MNDIRNPLGLGSGWWLARTFERHLARSEQSATAHEMLKSLLSAEPVSAVRARTSRGRSRRPLAISPEGRLLRWRLSVSHLDRMVAVVVSRERVGIDLVDETKPLPESFHKRWFTEKEHGLMQSVSAHRIWSAKEASYKALARNETFRPSMWPLLGIDDSGDVIVARKTQSNSHRKIESWKCRVRFIRLDAVTVALASSK